MNFADSVGAVSCLRQGSGKSRDIPAQRYAIAAHAVTARGASRQPGRPGGHAHRLDGVAALKPQPAGRQAVEVRCAHQRVAGAAEQIMAQLIRYYADKIRTAVFHI